MIKLKERLYKALQIGLFHIFSAYSLNQVIGFLTNIIIVHFLTKGAYGIFGCAYNIFSLFIMFTGFGMTGAELLFCSEERLENEKRAIYRYSLWTGLGADVLLSIGMVLYGIWGPVGIETARPYVLLLAALPLADYVLQYTLVYYRTKQHNKEFAMLSTVNSAAYLLFGSVFAYFGGIAGTIIGRYVAYIIAILFGIIKMNDSNKKDILNDERLSIRLKHSLWTYALKNGGCSALNQIMYLMDIALISALVSNPLVVASYKTATLIPEGLSFIPQAIIITLIPYYAKNSKNAKWLKETTKLLFISMLILNAAITLCLWIGAPLIIRVLWGSNYMDSVPYFRILSLSYFFLATFRLVSTNLLAVFRKITFNLVVAILTGVSNVILNFVLIKSFSAIGAAWATLIVIILASIVSFPYLCVYIKKMGNDGSSVSDSKIVAK